MLENIWYSYNRLYTKMSEVKCKILLSVEVIMYYFRILRETFEVLLPPLRCIDPSLKAEDQRRMDGF